MNRLRIEDWLEAAKRLPVGRNDRIQHRRDGSRRPNLVISHKADRWSAYCFACKAGAAVLKSHTRITDRVPEESTILTAPSDVILERDLGPTLRKDLEGFLLSKGVHGGMLDHWGYSPSRKRLVVYPDGWCGDASLGRDTTGKSNVKWIRYGGAGSGWLVEPVQPGTEARHTLVLTEDILSMYKVRWALRDKFAGDPWSGTWVGTTLGTGIIPSMLVELSERPFGQVAVFYDGDLAGEEGSRTVARRIRALTGSQVIHFTAPAGYDPKDLDYRGIIKTLNDRGVST